MNRSRSRRLYRAVPAMARLLFFAFLVWLYFWGLPGWLEQLVILTAGSGPDTFLLPLDAAAGLVFGVVSGLMLQVVAGMAFGMGFGSSVPMSFGGLAGLRRAGRGLALGFRPRRLAVLAITAVLAVGLAAIAVAPSARVPVVASVLAIVGLAALRLALAAPSDAGQVATPDTVLRRARASEALLAGVLPLVIGCVLGLAFGETGIASGVVTGAVAWLASAAVLVISGAWFRFSLSRGYLAATQRPPWRLMRFLHDAHHLGVLRQAGGVYQFRHRSLRDRLAGLSLPEDEQPHGQQCAEAVPAQAAPESAAPEQQEPAVTASAGPGCAVALSARQARPGRA